jgi:hypothetical protein
MCSAERNFGIDSGLDSTLAAAERKRSHGGHGGETEDFLGGDGSRCVWEAVVSGPCQCDSGNILRGLLRASPFVPRIPSAGTDTGH